MEGASVFGDDNADNNIDKDAQALLLHADKQFDNLNLGIAYVYASGNDPNSTDDEAFMSSTGLGKDFEPLYIMTGDSMGVLNGDGVDANGTMTESGVHALGLFAKYNVSDRLTLNGAIAWAKADEEQAGAAAAPAALGAVAANIDDSYGMEYDLGAAYKLLDNLTYEVHLGYLDTGDYFQFGNTTNELNNITMLSNHLTMTF